MARESKEARLQRIHQEALLEFDDVQMALRDERIQCLQDRRFYSIPGAMWEGPLQQQFENRPKLEVNKIHLSVIRIINEYRNNRISVDFVPKDGAKDDDTADTLDGLYRADEYDSCAEEAYDNAFEEAVGGGFGAWRLRAEYEDEEDEEDEKQRIKLEPIYDADSSVYFNLGAKRQDKSDATKCWVLSSFTHDDYTAKWGDSPTSWPKDIQQVEFDWTTPDLVFVAEYYRVEETTDLIRVFRGLTEDEVKYRMADFEEDEELEERLRVTGYKEVRQKRVKRKRVHKYIMSGGKVLEDCGYIAGSCIPIIPVYGKRWFVDNIERCMGHVRLAKDPQRLKNMQLSRLAEISAYSTIEKPIVTPEQVAGHQVMWSEDNIKQYPYLLLNPITDGQGNQQAAPPIGYTRAPNIPPAMAALLQVTETDIADILGNQDRAEELLPNVSGKAIELVQNRIDMQSFIYMSNFAKAMKRCGEVWLSMARELYVESDRVMKTVDVTGAIGQVTLMQPMMGDEGIEYKNDLTKTKFDVWVDIGPTSTSKRAASVRTLTGLMALTQDPATQDILLSKAIMEIEGENMQEVREFFRKKLVNLGVVKPTDEEMAEIQAAQMNRSPDPQTAFLMAEAQKSVAQADKAQADTLKAVADAKKTEAETIQTLAEVDSMQRKDIIETIQTIRSE